MKNIQTISDSYLCSNCGACYAICPKHAIVFNWSKIGRLSASVNDNCINCGLCQKVCPSIDKLNLHTHLQDRFVGNIQHVFIGKSTNESYYKNAQSGGVATGILAYLFDKGEIDGAIVCRMEYGKTPQVHPILIENKEDLIYTQKSCYTPVALLKALENSFNKKSIAIVGIPCHIQGVEALIATSNKFSNIKYKIGLICDKTECAGILKVIKNYSKFDVFKIDWRQKYNEITKSFNYKTAPIVAYTKEGERIEIPRHYRLAIKEMFAPPRCRICWDKLNAFSDITLGDPWKLEGIESEKGESLIITRTSIGTEIIMSMKNEGFIDIRETDKQAPLHSQAIEIRRDLVSKYSNAFHVIPTTADSYLLRQGSGRLSEKKYERVLLDFLKLEQCDEDQMIKIAIKNIKHNKTLNYGFRYRLLRKVKRLLNF